MGDENSEVRRNALITVGGFVIELGFEDQQIFIPQL